MSQLTLRRSTTLGSLLPIAIIILAVVTAAIHLDKAVAMGAFASHPSAGGPPAGGAPDMMTLIFQNLPTLFILNAIGYIVLVVALYLPPLKRYQRLIRWALIAFTAVTIIAYFALLGLKSVQLGYLDKAVEAVLLVLLVIEDRIAARQAKANVSL